MKPILQYIYITSSNIFVLFIHAYVCIQVLIVHSSDPLFDFRTTLRRSRFGLAPAGLGLHSYRLIEAMMHGAIPVLIAPDDNTVCGVRLRS